MQKYRISVYKLNVQILSQTPLTKKVLGNFELGEDEMAFFALPYPFEPEYTEEEIRQMEDTAAATQTSQAWPFQRITWSHERASQNRARRAFVFIKHIQ